MTNFYKNMANIKVIGVGGSGCNAILRMRKSNIEGVELIAINTDYQDLKKSRADLKLQIGREITQGLGTGMEPDVGRAAAMENKEEVSQILEGADMAFITGGLGGGTCSGAGPVIAEVSKGLGILTLAVVTLPFSFEGSSRRNIALESRRLLKERVDALVTIENDRLLEILPPQTSIVSAFRFCDDVLREAVKGISDLITLPGIININFADIKTILRDSGNALFGTGRARGDNRQEIAAKSALNSSLLTVSPRGAKGILFNVSGDDVSLSEIEDIGKILTKEINPKAKVIFGASRKNRGQKISKGEIKVTLIATGF